MGTLAAPVYLFSMFPGLDGRNPPGVEAGNGAASGAGRGATGCDGHGAGGFGCGVTGRDAGAVKGATESGCGTARGLCGGAIDFTLAIRVGFLAAFAFLPVFFAATRFFAADFTFFPRAEITRLDFFDFALDLALLFALRAMIAS